jgi:hypothetical protein
MLEKAIFAIEKLAALLTSQRTVATVVGVVVIVGMVWVIVAPLVGMEAGEMPTEEELEASIGQWLAVISTAAVGIVSVLQLVKALVEGMNERPPSLNSDDYKKQ